MRHEVTKEGVRFYIENPKSERPNIVQIKANSGIPTEIVDRLCKLVTRKTLGVSNSYKRTSIAHFLKPLLKFFETTGTPYPANSTEWQFTLLAFLRFVLVDQTHSTQSSKNRIAQWSGIISNTLDFFIDEGEIPFDVVIPKINLKEERTEAASKPLLGAARTEAIEPDETTKKLLVDTSYALSDEVFLEKIEASCREKVNTLRNVCEKHIRGMIADHQKGVELRSVVTGKMVKDAINNDQLRKLSPKAINSGKHGVEAYLTSDLLENGINWGLSIAHHLIETGTTTECISAHTLKNSQFYTSDISTFLRYKKLRTTTSLSKEIVSNLPQKYLFYRFSGILYPTDVAAICALFTIEHPRFTPQSLSNAKLLSVRGKSLVIAGDNSTLFSIDKPRAGSRKSEALSPLTKEILSHVVRVTAPIRQLLRRAGHKGWRYLFLGWRDGGSLGPCSSTAASYLAGKNRPLSLHKLYPELQAADLGPGTLTLKAVRNTMGVIRWFDTGSVVEMSRTMGNTKKVVLEHYLPPVLLQAWNNRIIRRFQQTLIVLAAHDEDYLLEISDFSSMNDLLHFIAQLVLEYDSAQSPIGEQIQKRLGKSPLSDEEISEDGCADGDRLLNIKLSASSLGILYAFNDYAKDLAEDVRARPDTQSGLFPQQFIDMSVMIRHACEREEPDEYLCEILDIAHLKDIHASAMQKAERYKTQFNSFSLNSRSARA